MASKNGVAMATCDTVDAKCFQNLVLQYILVRERKSSKVEMGVGTFRPPPSPQGRIGLNLLKTLNALNDLILKKIINNNILWEKNFKTKR